MQSNTASDRKQRSDFEHLWVAHTASIFGSHISLVAIPLLAIALLDANAFELGLLTAANLAPYLIAGLFVGIWVDRLPKRPLLMAADIGRVASMLAIPILVWTDQLTFLWLLLLTLMHGFLTVLFNVADVSFLPAVVPRAELPSANARLALSTSVARVSGPAAAGALIGVLSAPIALLIDAVSYLVSAVFIGKIGVEGHPDRVVEREPIRDGLTEGFRTLRGIPALFSLVASAALTSMFGMAFQTLLILFLGERIGLGATGIGLMLAVGGVGAVFGSLMSSRIVLAFGIGRAILFAQFCFGMAGLILPFALLVPSGAAIALVALSLFLQLAFNTVREVNGAAMSQALIPPDRLGRTQSTSLFSIKVFEVFGTLAASALAVASSVSVAIVLLELGLFISILPLFRGGVASIAQLTEIEAPA